MEERLKTRAQAHAGARPRVDHTSSLGLEQTSATAERVYGPALNISVASLIGPESRGFEIRIQRERGLDRISLSQLVQRLQDAPGSAEVEAAAKILHHLDQEMSQ